MSTTMTALNSDSIRHAEFIRLTMPSNTYTFCNAAGPITVDGITFSGLGDLLQLSNIQQDIKATSKDLSISLTGIDGNNVGIILSNEIKGSLVEVWRGFMNADNQIITSPTLQFFKRYQGIVNNVSIQEDFNDQARQRIATCTIACASFRVILENRFSGVRTTPELWKKNHPGDKSMDRVPVITAQYFDFGKPPTTGSQSVPKTTTTTGGNLIGNS